MAGTRTVTLGDAMFVKKNSHQDKMQDDILKKFTARSNRANATYASTGTEMRDIKISISDCVIKKEGIKL